MERVTLTGRGVLFVSQTPTTGDSGPVALWITAASWAAAAQSIWGNAWILTPEGLFSPEEALAHASRPGLASRSPRWWRRFAPELAVTAYKDITKLAEARRFRRSISPRVLAGRDIAFVWQHHDLFHTAGFAIARTLKRPLVLFVDAPVVWEDRKGGVHRPGWGRMVESYGESPQFRTANVIACVSEEVADEVVRRGGSEDRIIVTPCGVDPDRFSPASSGESVKHRWGLDSFFVVGWMGSFRTFHGVELIIRAVALLQESIPNLALLLVGDGQERHRMQELATELRLRNVRFTGTVPHEDMPEHIGAMDVAVVASELESGFHYSPIKLREYMASGRAIVAPRVGQVQRTLEDGVDAVLVDPGDPGSIARALQGLYRDEHLREALGRAARESVLSVSWEKQVQRLQLRLEEQAGV
jgi:glycosyltransferase involved in cell wall biosynthesis